METMEQLLDGKKPEIEVVESTGVKAEESEAEEDKTTEVEETKAEKEEESPPDSESDTTIPVAIARDERNKRQAVEKERDALQAQIAEANKTPPTSVFEDEAKFLQELDSRVNQSMTDSRLDVSEFFAAREFGREVLDQKIGIYEELVKDGNNQELKRRASSSVSPFHELVAIVDERDELDKMKDIDGYRAKIRAEERAAVKAELEKEEEDKRKLRDSVPDSLVGDPSAGGLTSTDADTPATPEDLYNP